MPKHTDPNKDKNFIGNIIKNFHLKKKKKRPVYSELRSEVRKQLVEITKGFGNMTPEAGVHAHGLPRNLLRTWIDGRHLHLFIIPLINGGFELLEVEEDGEHGHGIDEITSNKTDSATSGHIHVLRILRDIITAEGLEVKAGMAFITEFGGEHEHGADMLDSTNFDGAHDHEVILGSMEDGTVIRAFTLDVAGFIELFGGISLEETPRIQRASDVTRHTRLDFSFPLSGGRVGVFKGFELEEEEVVSDTAGESLLLAAFGQKQVVQKQGKEIIFKQDDTQELILSKKIFKTPDEATAKARELNFPDADAPVSEPGRFRIRVERPSNFKKDTLQEISLETGVRVMIGERKDSVAKDDELGNYLEKHLSENMPDDVTVVEIMKQDKKQQIVMGVVLEPDMPRGDADGDIISAEDIEKAQRFHMLNGQTIGFRHKKKAGQTRVVQSFIAPTNMVINKQKVKKGSWVLAVQILNKALWADVEADRIRGFSVGGFGERTPITGASTKE